MSRSFLVHRAAETTPSRFELVRATAKAARAIHRPHQRLAESINQALVFIADPSEATRQLSASFICAIDPGTDDAWRAETAGVLQEPEY
jgi:hypothetical protein